MNIHIFVTVINGYFEVIKSCVFTKTVYLFSSVQYKASNIPICGGLLVWFTKSKCCFNTILVIYFNFCNYYISGVFIIMTRERIIAIILRDK